MDDPIGEHLASAHVVRDLVRLSFMMERRYFPYSKWLGTAFTRLAVFPSLGHHLRDVLEGEGWDERQAALHRAYAVVVDHFNRLGLVDPFPTRVSPYYDRPYLVIHADVIAEALRSTLSHSPDRAAYDHIGFVGSVDQMSDNTDFLANPRRTVRYRTFFRP